MRRTLGKLTVVGVAAFLMAAVGLVMPANAATQRKCEEAGYSYYNGSCYDPNSAKIAATSSDSAVLAFRKNTCNNGSTVKVGEYIYCAVDMSGGSGGGGSSDSGGSSDNGGGGGTATSIEDAINKLPNSNGVSGDFLRNLLNWIYALAGLIAVVIIIYGGIKYNTAQGDPGKVKQAGQIIAFAVVGLVIVLLAAAITAFATGAIGGAV